MVKEWSVADSNSDPWMQFKADSNLQPLLSVPVTSAPVERFFSQIGLIMRPNRASLGKKLLCQLDFLKCNTDL